MTAAHCTHVKDWTMFSARLGEWDTEAETDCYQGDCADAPIDVPIEQKIAHEKYSPKDPNTHHDIAIVRLAKPVASTYFIKPICLPTESKFRSAAKDYSGLRFDVSGWGKTEYGVKSRYKLAASVPVQTMSSCQSAYRPNGLTITDKQICAGGQSKYTRFFKPLAHCTPLDCPLPGPS